MNKDQIKTMWAELEAEFPEIVEHFRTWIDEYKKEIDWSSLFQPAIKFHDLPAELQQGVLIRYTNESAEYWAENEKEAGTFFAFVGHLQLLFEDDQVRRCRKCGCTDDDCSQCIQKTGHPCHWVEEDLCSACESEDQQVSSLLLPGRDF